MEYSMKMEEYKEKTKIKKVKSCFDFAGRTSYIWGVLDGKFFEIDISGMYVWFGKLLQETNIYVGGITFIQDGCRQEQDYYFTYDENSHQFVLNE